MTDYLSKKDWRAAIKHEKKVKRTGMSEVFEALAGAVRKRDLDKQSMALDEIIDKANGVRARHRDNDTVTDFLARTIRAAEKMAREVDAERAKAARAQLDRGAQDGNRLAAMEAMAKLVRKVRQLSPDSAWNFVVAPGRPVSGLVLTRRRVRTSDVKKAYAMKGKKGVYFTGAVHGGNGGLVFELEAQPPGGLAKMIKRAIKLHAGLSLRVTIRGGGVEFDDEQDLEEIAGGDAALDAAPGDLDDQAADPADTDHAVLADLDDRVTALEDRFEDLAGREASGIEGALDGLIGAAAQLRRIVETSPGLGDEDREDLVFRLDGLAGQAQQIPDAAGSRSRLAAYPGQTDLRRLVDRALSLDPERRSARIDRVKASLRALVQRIADDADLAPDERAFLLAMIRAEVARCQTALDALDRARPGMEALDPALAARMAAIDNAVREIVGSAIARQPQTIATLTSYRGFRSHLASGDLDAIAAGIDPMEAEILDLRRRAGHAGSEARRREQHEAIKAELAPQMAYVKKAAFPAGAVTASPEIARALRGEKLLRKVVERGAACLKQPDAARIAALAEAASAAVSDLADRRRSLAAELDEAAARGSASRIARLEAKLAELTALDKVAGNALQRARLAELAVRFDAITAQPTDAAAMEALAQLQAEFYFTETAVKQGVSRAGASGLGAEGGASESWWIERARGGYDDDGAEKAFIFKPAVREATVFSGLPQGSGAPREALARTLDEAMAEAGFRIGVCPTVLAEIDASVLPGFEPDAGAMLGSMQKVADNIGSVAEVLGDDPDAMARIDAREYGDIAVFDMLFANLDRHGNNLLVTMDDGGNPGLLPIDHGSGLPDPEALQICRESLGRSVNAMLDPCFPQARDLLAAETREALGRIDPQSLAATMAGSRDGIEGRHGALAGAVSDAAIEGLAKRLEFLQAACDRLTVEELFEALGTGALRIAQCPADGMVALADTLCDEARRNRAAQEAFEPFRQELERQWDQVIHFKRLGWFGSLSRLAAEGFFGANPVLVERIARLGATNASLEQQIADALATANDPELEARVASEKRLTSKIAIIERADRLSDLPDQASEDAGELARQIADLETLYDGLGGDAEWAAATRVSPSCATFALSFEEGFDRLKNKIEVLREWQAFTREGGLAEYARLGGTGGREGSIKLMLERLLELKRSKAQIDWIMAMTEEEVTEAAEAALAGRLDEIDAMLAVLGRPGRETFAAERQRVADAWAAGNLLGAQTVAVRTIFDLRGAIASEAQLRDRLEVALATLIAERDSADQSAQDALAPHARRLHLSLREAIDTADQAAFDAARQEWTALLAPAPGDMSETPMVA
ncbi:hypothetical protein LNKW23_43800 [Paralimibaculum aggregatum]|uniref:PI3K/PI4K catalytic domain-containing protein n=2 Tax=Paralimibaculum aggregatum TaxID=3036245 RepID=A0ABQ6LSV3_9RHOB|nr:hypothetical protein LNKW23_43800 [Limibaculum sp. NKW23]